MPKTKISEYSATANSNTDINSINIAEGCAPSNINDAIRELMAELKDFQAGTKGDSFNGPVGTSTAAAGAFTTLSASSTVSGTGFSTYLASPPAIGGTAAAAGSFTTLTTSSTVTLNGGTANGVLYLNGSKVATSGSALTFDGTNLGVGTATPAAKLDLGTTVGKDVLLVYGGGSGSQYGLGISGALLELYTSSSGSISFNQRSGASYSEQMRLTSTGLGIGTSSPAYKLDVSSSAEVVGRFARSAGSNALLLIQDPTTTAAPYIASYGNAMAFGRYGGGESVRIDSNGNFLVNTTTSITGSNRMVVRQSGTSNPSTALNSGSWTGAFVSGEPALQLSSNIVAATGIPGSTETARGGIGFEYISSANPTDFIIGIFGSPTVASPVKFFNGSERMRLDSSGNLGLGVTPSAWVSNFKAFQVGTGGTFYGDYNNTTSYFGNNAYFNGTNWKYVSSSYALYAYQDRSAGKHVWAVAASGTAGNNITWTEAMTLDSSGNLLVGTTSNNVAGRTQARLNVAAGSYDTVQLKGVSASYLNIASWIPISGSTAYHIGFGDGTSSYTERGVISTNGVGTTYGTASDYRLKENVQPMHGALAKVAALKPVTYTWKENGLQGEGFIAHELQEVCPNAVVGEKDAVKENGDPKYQNIDTSFLVATLTAAIQEQQAIIEQLKARLDAANL